MLREVLEIR